MSTDPILEMIFHTTCILECKQALRQQCGVPLTANQKDLTEDDLLCRDACLDLRSGLPDNVGSSGLEAVSHTSLNGGDAGRSYARLLFGIDPQICQEVFRNGFPIVADLEPADDRNLNFTPLKEDSTGPLNNIDWRQAALNTSEALGQSALWIGGILLATMLFGPSLLFPS